MITASPENEIYCVLSEKSNNPTTEVMFVGEKIKSFLRVLMIFL